MQSFKTNIKCGGCISKVRPYLDGSGEIRSWHVDLNSPDRILTIEGEISSELVVKIIAAAGYKAEPIF
jgi:copper chaperone